MLFKRGTTPLATPVLRAAVCKAMLNRKIRRPFSRLAVLLSVPGVYAHRLPRGQVFFYPKDGTPGCTKEAQTFQADLAKFEELGAEVIGISSDQDHGKFVQDNGLSMTLLSDVNGKVSCGSAFR